MSKKVSRRPASPAPMILAGIGLMVLAVVIAVALADDVRTASELRQSVQIPEPAQVNFPMPDIRLTDLDGNPVALSDYRGSVVLYNAWATWCPPCKEEMPALQAYYEAYAARGFVVVAIEDGQPIDEVRAFVKSYGLTFPVLPDVNWVATKTLGINGLPTSYVIDRAGNVRYIWKGAVTFAALEKYVTPMLAD
jgi:peroxiredoxin